MVEPDPGTELETIDVNDTTTDPEALREAQRRIGEVARLAEVVDASINEADEAAEAAQSARTKSARMFQQKQAIAALQDAGVEASEALVSLANSQKHLFENQQALARLIRELTAYALGSIANTRVVYRRLQETLSGAPQGELSELAERELRNVMLEVKHQLDLAEQQERADRKLLDLRRELSQQRRIVEQTTDESREELHRLRVQIRAVLAAAITGIAVGVAAVLLSVLR